MSTEMRGVQQVVESVKQLGERAETLAHGLQSQVQEANGSLDAVEVMSAELGQVNAQLTGALARLTNRPPEDQRMTGEDDDHGGRGEGSE